jgi:hypothetical protein
MKTYRTMFTDPDNRRNPKTSHYCARCHKDLKPGQPFRVIHMVDGGPFALHPEDEALYTNATTDMGCFPVGMDCARRIGLEFTHDNSGFPVLARSSEQKS